MHHTKLTNTHTHTRTYLVQLEQNLVVQIDEVRVARIGQRVRNTQQRFEEREQQLEQLIVLDGALAAKVRARVRVRCRERTDGRVRKLKTHKAKAIFCQESGE